MLAMLFAAAATPHDQPHLYKDWDQKNGSCIPTTTTKTTTVLSTVTATVTTTTTTTAAAATSTTATID